VNDSKISPCDADNTHSDADKQARPEQGKNRSTMSKSMHDGVEVWCDCCSCEAEPYWLEAMKDYDEKA
jgi:hypothetical protein